MDKPLAATTSPGVPSPLDLATPSSGVSRPPHPAPMVPDHQLLRPIGNGAYGEVWLARNVMGTWRAIKMVHRQDFSEDYPFEREFKGIQKFEPVSRSHEGLIDILQIGRNDDAGYFYYVMELADDAAKELREDGGLKIENGDRTPVEPRHPPSSILNPPDYTPRTLRHELKQRGRLPPDECVAIGLALSGALDYLHAQGLVHRDVKPSNIIFVHGVPKLADIGLVADASEARSFVGTVGFLAPEGPGSPQADLYSLGKVLYEAATGLDRGRFPDLPEDLKTWPDAAQVIELNEVILKACANDVRQRHASARALHDELALLQRGGSMHRRRWWEKARGLAAKAALVLAAVLVSVLVVTALARRQFSPAPAAPADKTSIFVLPFRSVGTNTADEDLRDRITDAFIDSLPLIEGVRVGSRKSGWIYRDEDAVRREVGKAFNVRHALTGRVATPPGQVSIEVSLFETDGDRKLWCETFVGGTNEVVELETKAIHRIAATLGLEITAEEQQRIHQKLTNNLEALRLRRQAYIHIFEGTKPGHTLAIEVLGQALELDPNYLDAEITASFALYVQGEDLPHRQVWSELKTRSRRILQMDDTHFVARMQLLNCQLFNEWDWKGATAGFEALKKENPEAHLMWAIYNRVLGRTNEARLEQVKAEQGSPSGITVLYHGAASRFCTERCYDEAMRLAKLGLERSPNNPLLVSVLAQCLIACKRYPEAVTLLQEGLAKERKHDLVSVLACAYAAMGVHTSATNLLQELKDLSRGAYVQPYYIARVYAALGDKPEVWKWLNKAVEDRSDFLVHPDGFGLRTDPAWDGLREEPEFKELLKKVGLDVWPK